jgi:TonB family protein
MKGHLLLAALVLTPGTIDGQATLPVTGRDVPMPHLLSTGVPVWWRGSIGDYPEFGRPNQGVWAVRFRITPEGRVRDLALLTGRAGPDQEFALIRDRMYEPALVNGQPTSVVAFELIQRVTSEQALFDGLAKIASNPALPEEARVIAVEDLGAFPSTWRGRAIEVLNPLLGSPSAALRQSAIDASEALGAGRRPLVADRDVPAPRRRLAGAPIYDPRDRMARRQGVIPLSITVGPNGRPLSVSLLHHIPGLDESVIEAAYKWTYDPTVVGGRRHSVQVQQSVSFLLDAGR